MGYIIPSCFQYGKRLEKRPSRLKVQVFATTHSWESINAAYQALVQWTGVSPTCACFGWIGPRTTFEPLSTTRRV